MVAEPIEKQLNSAYRKPEIIHVYSKNLHIMKLYIDTTFIYFHLEMKDQMNMR